MMVRPGARFAADATVMLMAPASVAAERVVFPVERVMIDVLFSSSLFASPTPPTPPPRPGRVYGTHGAGAVRFWPVPPRDGGSLLTMLKFGSADGVGGLLAGLP